jgi:hypothetical protein
MELPLFILSDSIGALKSKQLIICTNSPFVVGRVYQFGTGEEMGKWIDRHPGAAICMITGYRMLIAYQGCMLKQDERAEVAMQAYVMRALHMMRDFYLQDKIMVTPTKYNRFKTDYTG